MNISLKTVVTIFLIIISSSSRIFSQNLNLDSLWKIYNNKVELDTNRLNALNKIIQDVITENPDSAIILANQQLTVARQKNQKTSEYNALSNLGEAYYKLSNFKKSLIYFKQALVVSDKLSNEIFKAQCFNHIEKIYFSQSDYKQALSYSLKSLAISEKLSNKSLIGVSFVSIANVYLKLSDYNKALEYNLKALEIAKISKKNESIAASYSNIGIIYSIQKEFDLALEYFSKSVEIREKIGDKNGMGRSLNNMGSCYYDKKNYEKAIEYYTKSLKIRKEIGDKFGEEFNLSNIGNVYSETGKFDLAISFFDSALVLSKEIGDIDGTAFIYENLASVNQKTNNYKQAYNYYVLFKELNDSIYNVENSEQISDLKTAFEVDKKEVELNAKAKFEQDNLKTFAKQEKIKQQLIIAAIFLVLIIVLIFSIFLYKRFKIIQKQKQIIERKNIETEAQKFIIEEKHKEITDSINYAERIQRALLANKKILDENIADYFILFKPKDVVSGDFYWATKLVNGNFVIVTADSTGHGVPGAIMSILNIACLKEAVTKGLDSPELILNETRKLVIENLMNDGSTEGGKDGMDGSLLSFDFKNKIMHCASANNPVWIIRGNELIEIKADRMPIGKHANDKIPFSLHTQNLQKGDVVYTLTDGFADQFGGVSGKKFKYKQLQAVLVSINGESMEIQKQKLDAVFNNWKGNLEQIDDVCIIGVKI